jgi:hypothetical protein
VWQGAKSDTNDTQVRRVVNSERIVKSASIHENVARRRSRCVTSNGLQFTGANRDAMNEGSRSTVKQRLASGATACWTALCLRRVLAPARVSLLVPGDAWAQNHATKPRTAPRPARFAETTTQRSSKAFARSCGGERVNAIAPKRRRRCSLTVTRFEAGR